ncbi:hypothetical protein CVT25_009445 [Psilocybe cyanescens]|uniref:Uncharacterized protein n=1 Tax=Psilocybe cyanescens TaxID=93625 RepID=A0A409WVY6_PSICY|nr:hypothetical protein CVT25_009445 [Psilocybe cyanescens]
MASRQLRSRVIPGGNRVPLPELKSPVAPDVQTPRRSYSDVAASRPSSPSAEVEKRVITEPPKVLVEDIHNNNENPFVSDEHSDPNITSSESESDDDGPWTTVQSKRKTSCESFCCRNNKLRTEVATDPAIDKAEKSLTQEQQKLIAKHKGKTIDPREWGNLSISNVELDVQTQRKEFEKLAKAKQKEQLNLVTAPNLPRMPAIRFDQTAEHVRMPAAQKPLSARPVAHVDPKSFLGAALKKVSSTRKKSCKSKKRAATTSSESPSSSSEPSSGDPDGSDDSSSSSDESSSQSEDDDEPKAKPSKHKKCWNKGSSSAKALKPTPYDGTVSAGKDGSWR